MRFSVPVFVVIFFEIFGAFPTHASVDEQIKAALSQDLDLRAAETELKKAEAAFEFRWRSFLPTISLSTTEGRTKVQKLSGEQEDVTVASSSVNASINLFAGGASLSSYKSDSVNLERQRNVFQTKRRSAVLAIGNDLFAYIFLRKRTEHLLRQMSNRDQQEEIASKKYKAGVLSQQEWMQTSVARDFQRAELLTIENEMETVKNRLALNGLMDLGPQDWPLTAGHQLSPVQFPEVNTSPEVRALVAEVDLLEWQRHSYRAGYLPAVDYFLAGTSDRKFTKPSELETVHGLRLSWSFGDSGQALLESRKASLDLDLAKVTLERTKDRVGRNQEELKKKVMSLRTMVSTLRDSTAKSQTVITSLRRAFQIGRLSVTDLLQEENTHLQYLTNFEQLTKELHSVQLQVCLAAEIGLERCFY